MKGKHIELPEGSYVDINDVIEKYDHSPIAEMQSVVEKIMIERAKKVDSVILGEIQQIAVENGLETKIFLNEQNVADALRNYQDGYAHIKAEVAREIFEEIERLITKECLIFKDENGIRGYVDASVHYAIAELKKKYAEDKPNDN